MAKSDLTADVLRQKFIYNPDTGEFKRIVNSRRRPNTLLKAGTKTFAGYIAIYVDGYTYTAHRLAWLYVHGSWPTGVIDHINGIKDDNRIKNLRDTTYSVNAQNVSSKKQRLLPTGVCLKYPGRKKSFSARIIANGKINNLGYFCTAEEAESAYLAAKSKLHTFDR